MTARTPARCWSRSTPKGRAVKVQGDPSHPVTQGFFCGKVAKYLDRVYSPQRILHPLRRKPGVSKGPLEKGRELESFEPVSWDEALDAIAARLQQISDIPTGPNPSCPTATPAPSACSATARWIDDSFIAWERRSSTAPSAPRPAARPGSWSTAKNSALPMRTFPKAKLILAWGANIHGNNIHLWPFVEQARRNGARLIVIDPYRTRTAALADWHIAIRPGTDAALALG
jgi:anaerobic selenocysteine-containing dehydrogenase